MHQNGCLYLMLKTHQLKEKVIMLEQEHNELQRTK
jgi:hypothetical protein